MGIADLQVEHENQMVYSCGSLAPKLKRVKYIFNSIGWWMHGSWIYKSKGTMGMF